MAKPFQVVVFQIGKELYSVGIDSVHEIVRIPCVTEVPDAPPFLEGVINLRGRVIPVIDLRKKLGLPAAEWNKSTRVLITENAGAMVGLLVDAVAEVKKLPPESVDAPPEMIAAVGIEYITGVAKVDDMLIILLDLRKVLSLEGWQRTGDPPGRQKQMAA